MPSLSVNERWQAEKCTVLQRNKFMFGNKLMSDITFAFPPNTERTTAVTIPAHKYVLAISSPVFFRQLAELQDNTVVITDCDPEVFRCFLGFLYCDEANFLDVDFAINVWHLAGKLKYDVPSLASECVMFLDGCMDHASAFRVIPYARLFHDERLERICWEVIDYNARALVCDDCFLGLSHELLLSFLERSSLCIDEITLFLAVNRWATNRCKQNGKDVSVGNKRAELGRDVLKKIRFTLMTAKQFSEIVVPEEILTKDDVVDVYKAFYSNYSSAGVFEFPVLPRATDNETVCSCRLSNVPLYRINQQYAEYVNDSKMLTFVTDESILLCGLQFLFDANATSGWVTLSLWRQGIKMKQITARSLFNESWKTNPCGYGSNVVFFNRPICVDRNTCYTIKLQGQSSCSDKFRVTNESSDFVQLPVGCSTHSIIRSNTKIEFRFCEGLFSNEIPKGRPYIGHIEYLLFYNKPCPSIKSVTPECNTDSFYCNPRDEGSLTGVL